MIKLILTGGRRDFTGILPVGGIPEYAQQIPFKNGEAELDGDYSTIGGLLKYMERCYKAYPEGHPAIRKDLEENGISKPDPSPQQHSNQEVQGQARPTGQEASPIPANDGSSAAPSGDSSSGGISSGDGHSNAGVHSGEEEEDSEQSRISETLKLLDHDNDSHWTADGLPAVEAVSQLCKDVPITRKKLNAYAPDFKRLSRQGT